MKKCPRSLYGDQWKRCKHFDGFIGNKVPMCYWFVMPVTDIMTNCCQIWQQYNLSVSLKIGVLIVKIGRVSPEKRLSPFLLCCHISFLFCQIWYCLMLQVLLPFA